MVTVTGAKLPEQPLDQPPPDQPRAPAPVNYTQGAPAGAPAMYQPPPAPPVYQPTPAAPVQPSAPPVAAAPQFSSSADPSIQAVQNYYQRYLGRAANPDDPTKWLSGAYGYGTDLATIENAIRNSPEAQAYARTQGGSGSGAGGGDLKSRIDAALAAARSTDDPNYWYQKIGADPNGAGSAWAYWQDRINRGDGAQLGLPKFQDSGGGGGYGGTNVFSDPATANFEKLLNDMIGRFNTPATPPDYQASLDQLKAYLARLNGPVYTPAEMELQQTQALNPMQQQHDAAKQQLIARMGSQGIAPGSGIMEKALEDLDRQFQQARTTTQANFATQAIGLDRQNAATAAALAPQISGLEQQQTQWQDQRAQQAATLAAFIPQMALQRLQAASGSIQPLNPTSLLTMLQSFQNQGYSQGANYGDAIAKILQAWFGVGGGY